jgi:microcystin-dependent protein
MATNPFIGQLQLFPFGYAPAGWAVCDGQTLPINKNQALFSLLGTTYGGDGVTNFKLPDLRGRTPVSFGPGFTQGQAGGEEFHTLTTAEVPAHSHTLTGTSSSAGLSTSANNLLGKTAGSLTIYNSGAQNLVGMKPASVTSAGGGAPHENRTPFLAMTWCIALVGIFPSRN